MKNCWDLKGCPCSHYMNCQAYEEKMDCWAIGNGCLCHVYHKCETCPIFKAHRKDKAQESVRSDCAPE